MESKISRRDVFRIIGGVTALVPLSYATGVWIGGYAPQTGLKTLSDKQAAILESAAEVIIPNDNALGLSIKDVHLTQQMDEFLGDMASYNRHKVEVLFLAVEHLFPMRCFYFRKFSRLSLEHRQQIINRMDRGGAGERALVRALKALVQSIYYNDPRVAERIGIEGQC